MLLSQGIENKSKRRVLKHKVTLNNETSKNKAKTGRNGWAQLSKNAEQKRNSLLKYKVTSNKVKTKRYLKKAIFMEPKVQKDSKRIVLKHEVTLRINETNPKTRERTLLHIQKKKNKRKRRAFATPSLFQLCIRLI